MISGTQAVASPKKGRRADLSLEWRSELLDPSGWAEVLRTFAVTMKAAVALTDPQGMLLGECHNPQPTWLVARGATPQSHQGCPFCLGAGGGCNVAAEALRTGQVTMVEDQAGFSHIAAPLILDGQPMGALIAGQVFCHYPELLRMQRVARNLGVSPQELWQSAVQQAPITQSTLQLYGDLLMSLGQAVLGERYSAILQRKLAQTSERYRMLIEGVKDYALYTLDEKNHITSWNKGAERLFGYEEVEMIGRDVSTLLATEDPSGKNMRQAMLDADRMGSVEVEGWRLRKDGTRFLAAGVLASMGSGETHEYGKLFRDVTESRSREQDLQQSQKLESIGVLAGGIAHDFNNLLTGILSGLSFIKSGLPQDDPAYPVLEIAQESSERAAELVAQLLAYAGQGKFAITRFDLSKLISDMVPLVAASIPKSVRLDLLLKGGLPWIEGDASQIRQIVMNLIINGAESIGPGGGTVRVLTGVDDSGTELLMEVKDSGSGMSETTKAKMFEPFFTTKTTGRGLGLAAVAGIVRSHKGTMVVDSSIGHGTTFTICFPAVARDLPKLVTPPAVVGARAAGVILVVDDEEGLRKLAALILEQAGYKVLTAEDGRQGVDIFRQNAFDIGAVVLDMSMPVMGGQEALELIREIRPNIPIIVSSGYGATFPHDEGGAEVVVAFIQKPYSAAQLVESVEKALQVGVERARV